MAGQLSAGFQMSAEVYGSTYDHKLRKQQTSGNPKKTNVREVGFTQPVDRRCQCCQEVFLCKKIEHEECVSCRRKNLYRRMAEKQKAEAELEFARRHMSLREQQEYELQQLTELENDSGK